MKKLLIFLLSACLLTGCGVQETFETVSDMLIQPAIAEPREISVDLPGEAAVSAMQNENGRLYICDDYEITIETIEAGDLNGTIRTLSGYDKEDLMVVQTEADGMKRYEFVWAAAGERGEKLGHSVILDDGNYHYTLTVLRDADTQETSQIIWSRVFQSFSLA